MLNWILFKKLKDLTTVVSGKAAIASENIFTALQTIKKNATSVFAVKKEDDKLFFNIDTTNRKIQIYDTDGATVREEIDGNGFKQIRYRDEYVGGDWLVPAGATAPDEVTITLGGIPYRMYAFDGGVTEETLTNIFEMPHDLAITELNAETVFLEAHVHWMPSTNDAGNVIWFFDYCYIPVNAAPISQTTIQKTAAIALNEQYFHKITAFESGGVIKIPKPASGFNLGDVILFRLRRTPNTAGDDYEHDALLVKCALHVPTNDYGSRQRYIK